MDFGDTIGALYASEINCGIQSFWDGGWEVWIGDDMNGRAAGESGLTFSQLPLWLHTTALKLYPDSVYAKGEKA